MSLGYNGRAPYPRRVFEVSESKQTYSKPLDQQRLLHILLREIVFSGDKIKISLWDLRDTGLSLQETSATDWFANSQIWLPGLDVVRTFSEENIEIPIYGIPLQHQVRAH